MNKLIIRTQILLGTAFLIMAFWEAHVAKTHEPIASYNDATIAAYYYTVMKCVINIFSGLLVYLECISDYYANERSQLYTIIMIHYSVSILGLVLYCVGYFYQMLKIYRLVILLDANILIIFICLVYWAQNKTAIVPEMAVPPLEPMVQLDPALVYPNIV
jgi:hypothetical protein